MPLACSVRGAGGAAASGPVWAVAFDRGGAFTPRHAQHSHTNIMGTSGDDGVPRVLAATQGGLLGAFAPAQGGKSGSSGGGEALHYESCGGVMHVALDASHGGGHARLAAVTQAEALLTWDAGRAAAARARDAADIFMS